MACLSGKWTSLLKLPFRLSAALALGLACGLGCGGIFSGESMAQTGNPAPGNPAPGNPAQANRARPGHLAELEELQAARRAGTLAAYDLFIARHPASRYAPEARKERAALQARQ